MIDILSYCTRKVLYVRGFSSDVPLKIPWKVVRCCKMGQVIALQQVSRSQVLLPADWHRLHANNVSHFWMKMIKQPPLAYGCFLKLKQVQKWFPHAGQQQSHTSPRLARLWTCTPGREEDTSQEVSPGVYLAQYDRFRLGR